MELYQQFGFLERPADANADKRGLNFKDNGK
jgi:hypothetical protein